VEVIFWEVNGTTVFRNERVYVADLAPWLVKLEARPAG
jgi:hypothetical protein